MQISQRRSDAHLPTQVLRSTLVDDGPGTLHEPWLDRVGVAGTVTDAGTVLTVILATGETDHAVLDAQIAAAEPKAAELVNRARAEAALPPVRPDPALVATARKMVAESIQRACFVGFDRPGCGGHHPNGADEWFSHQTTWVSGENAFSWYLAPAQPGEDKLTRFGAAAALGPDGTVWAVLLMAV